MNQCSAIKANGERCTLPSHGQHGLCWAHDPKNHEKRRRTASKGGRSKANKEIADLKACLKELIQKIEDEELEPTQGNTIIRAYSTILEAIRLERSVFVEDDLARRIEELKRGEREDAS